LNEENNVRIAYVSFLECEVRGNWQIKTSPEVYKAEDDNCEVSLVRPDLLRRTFVFKKNSYVYIIGSMLKFFQNDVIDELSVDEDAQSGKNNS
jgi:hypothetical protein